MNIVVFVAVAADLALRSSCPLILGRVQVTVKCSTIVLFTRAIRVAQWIPYLQHYKSEDDSYFLSLHASLFKVGLRVSLTFNTRLNQAMLYPTIVVKFDV